MIIAVNSYRTTYKQYVYGKTKSFYKNKDESDVSLENHSVQMSGNMLGYVHKGCGNMAKKSGAELLKQVKDAKQKQTEKNFSKIVGKQKNKAKFGKVNFNG